MQASVRVYGRGGEGGDTFLLSHVCGTSHHTVFEKFELAMIYTFDVVRVVTEVYVGPLRI